MAHRGHRIRCVTCPPKEAFPCVLLTPGSGIHIAPVISSSKQPLVNQRGLVAFAYVELIHAISQANAISAATPLQWFPHDLQC
eukprot:scaffold155441_cov22-Prasinocladus_malaysianus.AAC.1